MVIHENAYYKGKLWCAYELKDNNGNYKEEYRLDMRKESQAGAFICPECGEPLILCAGPIMEPYFKHHDDAECASRMAVGSGRSQVIRRMLYQMLRRSFPKSEIDFNVRFKDGIIADIYVKTLRFELVLEYLSQDIRIAEWEEKHDFYRKRGIREIWILSAYRRPMNTITTFEYLVTRASPVIKVFDHKTQKLTLKKRIENGISQGVKVFVQEYPIALIRVDEQGEVLSSFDKICEQEKERTRLEQQKEEQRRRQKLEQRVTEREAARAIKKQEQLERGEEQLEQSSVVRSAASQGRITKNTMKMTAIAELWELPMLRGSDAQIRRGNQIRYLFLKQVNNRLKEMDEDARKLLIEHTIRELDERKEASHWRG